jgi:hypothetical protein
LETAAIFDLRENGQAPVRPLTEQQQTLENSEMTVPIRSGALFPEAGCLLRDTVATVQAS